ncbi:hypothetical protein N7462_006433 [Penicillium macrosclerotiorum]|uniref:uncharacterized protein n=1 Tax=Penicillium macrosclerotiorum TaxID=303699 RepID=UPI002546F7B4|nr:uncharacterized protein N7462_006433 [Penicillium macrosclerotiorum]KAJ5683268.1 hypothetical protein N7462_006433 [Penicillium macrosclerotiorum]
MLPRPDQNRINIPIGPGDRHADDSTFENVRTRLLRIAFTFQGRKASASKKARVELVIAWKLKNGSGNAKWAMPGVPDQVTPREPHNPETRGVPQREEHFPQAVGVWGNEVFNFVLLIAL